MLRDETVGVPVTTRGAAQASGSDDSEGHMRSTVRLTLLLGALPSGRKITGVTPPVLEYLVGADFHARSEDTP